MYTDTESYQVSTLIQNFVFCVGKYVVSMGIFAGIY